MDVVYSTKSGFCELSSFSDGISFDDASQSPTIDIQHLNESVSQNSNDSSESPLVNVYDDADESCTDEDLIPFETFIDMGQF